MNVKIKSIRFDADKKLLDFITVKVKKLVQFYDEIIGAEVFLRIDKDQELENKVVEIKLEIPGNDLFAKKQSRTFEESTDNAIDALRSQIDKHKTKLRK
ncbi:MAG: HPF/RaiA family ribosome-associated protein [Bacteroidota bacterium]|nr:HPF/RaiA family ribosome-associated protein [Bacteroidota bacterium]MDP4228395.1 HPF/RaiA family ribosome-associated protein [Bacteroidota bacterium]MDP4272781.1 HPF/RaiA family ribosome-associated protein [Bacteroidota bacterium]